MPDSITGVPITLSGEDGNAFFIIGRARGIMRLAEVDPEVIDAYTNEAMSGDYENVLRTTMRYMEVS